MTEWFSNLGMSFSENNIPQNPCFQCDLIFAIFAHIIELNGLDTPNHVMQS